VEAKYANIVTYRVTTREFVLEFGSFFPGQDDRVQHNPSDMHTRIVMPAELIESFITSAVAAKEHRDRHRAEAAAKLDVGHQEKLPI
jgi:hypothetical protein